MRRTILSASALALALIGPACHSGPGGLEPADAGAPSGTGGTAGAGAGGANMDGGAGSGPGLGRDAGTDGGPAASDSGFIGMRRLTNVEYARTIQDLLGLGGLDHQILSAFSGDGRADAGRPAHRAAQCLRQRHRRHTRDLGLSLT